MFTSRLIAHQRQVMTLASRQLPRFAVIQLPYRTYYKDNVLMPREQGEYYADPMDVAERVVRLMALHDNCKDPAAVTLGASFN